MLNKIDIKNFKSHKASGIELGNLTVLAGQNGVGKSSVIQSLLLLRQTFTKGRLDKILDLNSPLCFIGKTRDALYQFPDKEENLLIEFSLSSGEDNYTWKFDASNESSYLKRFNKEERNDGAENLSLFGTNFQYISAARTADYINEDYSVEVLKQISVNQGKGELTAHFLDFYSKSLKVQPSLLHPSEADPYLLSQATAWEGEISSGVKLTVKPVGESFEIRYSFNTGSLETDPFTHRNVGFGLSYALPIIVAILSASPGALLLIENPEAHLHPYGQAKLAELMCLAAQCGIQIIVETHSDHVINGILIQCKKFEESGGGISPDNLKIFSFERDNDGHKTIATRVSVGPKGKLKDKPNTFFDQLGKDLRNLF